MAEFNKLNGYDVADKTAREDIKTINGNIKNITDNIDVINENINKLEEQIEVNPNKLIIFGDSWSDKDITENLYPSILSNILNLELTNYAKNGAGFIQPSTNLIESQINTFLNSDIDKSTVKYIVLMGGINDYRNNVTSNDLSVKISTLATTLRTNCVNAEILYISNCQYPYSISQSFYWNSLHNFLATLCNIKTYSLDGKIGEPLFDSANYFHLTETGQQWLSRNIIACLTGGELIEYIDVRDFNDSDVKIRITTQKVNNMIFATFKFIPLTSFTQHTLNLNVGVPGISYVNDLSVDGFIDNNFNPIVFDINSNNIVIASQSQLQANNTYETVLALPITVNTNF